MTRYTRRLLRTYTAALFAGLLFMQAVPAQTLTPAEQADIQKDIARHFGDAPQDPGPKADNLSVALRKKDISIAVRKVAGWQLARAQPYFDRIWTWSVLYSGFMAASDALHDSVYSQAMLQMSESLTGNCAATLQMPTTKASGKRIWNCICDRKTRFAKH